MTTNLYKGRSGWYAETDYVLNPDTPRGAQVLRIYTGKSSNGVLYTSASVHFVRDGMVTFVVFGDFRKTIQTERERCTEKTVRAQHQRALDVVDAIKAEALAFYAKKGGVGSF